MSEILLFSSLQDRTIVTREVLQQVSQIVFDHAYELISSGSPAFDSEKTLSTLDLIASKHDLTSDLIYDLFLQIKEGNDSFREMGFNNA